MDDAEKLQKLADSQRTDLSSMEIVNQPDHELAARMVMLMARNGEADAVMKGSLETAVFMRAAVVKDAALRPGKLLTHIAI